MREPDGDGDVVGRPTEHDGEQTMHTQHQLGSAIVEDCETSESASSALSECAVAVLTVDVRLRAERRVRCEHGVDMRVHDVLVCVRRNVLAQPPSCQCPMVAGTHILDN